MHPNGAPAKQPQLATSGNDSKTKTFLRRAQSRCLHHGAKHLQDLTTHYSIVGYCCNQQHSDPVSSLICEVVIPSLQACSRKATKYIC